MARLLTCGLCMASAALAASHSPMTFQQVSIQRVKTTGVFFQRSAFSTARRTHLRVLQDGRVEIRAVSVVDLARLAYGFEDTAAGLVTSSAGAWTSSDRFDITATTNPPWRKQLDGDTVPSELRSPIQRLLEDRFALKVRSDTRNVPVYALRRTKGGAAPALRPSTNECLGPFTERPAGPAVKPRCALTLSEGRIVADGVTMADFARVLSRARRHDPIIVDETGLTGTYDIAVTVAAVRQSADAEVDIALMLLRQALAAQLGLDLKTGRRQMPALVVARARRPEESK